MMDRRRKIMSIGALLIFLMVAAIHPVNGDVVEEPTMLDGGYLEWTYTETSPDGSASREGVRTASISTGTWNSEDVFVLQGKITGTFATSEGSGTENGQWKGYYRQMDMSLMYMKKDIDIYIEDLQVTTTNESELFYEPPYYRWMKFPLSNEGPNTWDVDVDRILSWTLYLDGDEFSSGTDVGTESYRWACVDEQMVDVAAGTYDCLLVKEWKYEDEYTVAKNSSYWYSEEVGWWTRYIESEFYNDEMVITKEWELVLTSGNNPPLVGNIEEITMDEDTFDDSIDLESVFTDPEGDPLTFGAVDKGVLQVDIVGSGVRITPPEDSYGTFRFNLTAKDASNDQVKAPVKVIVSPVDDPTLIYYGSVSPSQGELDETFTFSVMLKDADGDDPGIVSVLVDGEEHSMSKVSGSMIHGSRYEWPGQLEMGEHQFHFETSSLRSPEVGEMTGPEVTTSEEPTLTLPGLDLEQGGTDTLFTFNVRWTDLQVREPDAVYLVVDDLDYFEMVTDDDEPDKGQVFTVSTFIDEGNHMYHFEAELDDLIIRYPGNGELQGPDVFDPKIVDSGVKGDFHTSGGAVGFFITLRYGLGETPDDVKLILDGNEYPLFDAGGDIREGMNLTRNMKLDPGTHRFTYFVLIDGIELATMEEQIVVEDASNNDDEEVDINEKKGLDPVTIVVIVIGVIVLIAVVLYFLSRKGPGTASDKDAEEEVTWEEGTNSNIRGL